MTHMYEVPGYDHGIKKYVNSKIQATHENANFILVCRWYARESFSNLWQDIESMQNCILTIFINIEKTLPKKWKIKRYLHFWFGNCSITIFVKEGKCFLKFWKKTWTLSEDYCNLSGAILCTTISYKYFTYALCFLSTL